MKYKILLEASGSLTSGYLIKSVQDAGALAVASDISECAGQYLADDFIKLPVHSDPEAWKVIENEMISRGINVVIPSFDETLLDWSRKKKYFLEKGIHVVLSDSATIEICQDKWLTYLFFEKANIPTPKTSLEKKYSVVKPRLGRGGKGVFINAKEMEIEMGGNVSQEFLMGQEYTIDVFCDYSHFPVYIIPRKRISVKDGKSINGITVDHTVIINWVKKICKELPFAGPLNMQCFEDSEGGIKFTEINPRVAGGMALGFAASENWISLIMKNILEKESIETKKIVFGLKMLRYYDELFVS